MMLQRLLLDDLLSWKSQPTRKPILLDGARQVGKSYLLSELFGKPHFRACHILDFYENQDLHNLFDSSLTPDALLKKIELYLAADIKPDHDLIIFDEIGESERALNSLKYFAEQKPEWFICASGSNIGLLKSFPVGKVHGLTLRPLNFEEFILATGTPQEIEAYNHFDRSELAHNKLWEHLVAHLFVGGMPEAVTSWATTQDQSIRDRRSAVHQIHQDIVAGYERDFGKYSGQVNALHIHQVFANAAKQLQQTIDQSAKKYSFKNVLSKKDSYRDFRSTITWLEKAHLLSRNSIITERPRVPLSSSTKESTFKLFYLDIGLLSYSLRIPISALSLKNVIYKGPIIENFIQNELISYGSKETFAWKENKAEIEFLLEDGEEIIPLEVKAGKNTRALSLASYKNRYNPQRTIKLYGQAGGSDETDLVLPLYYVKHLLTQLQSPTQ